MVTLRMRPIDRWPKEQTPASERLRSPFLRHNRTEVPYSQTLDIMSALRWLRWHWHLVRYGRRWELHSYGCGVCEDR